MGLEDEVRDLQAAATAEALELFGQSREIGDMLQALSAQISALWVAMRLLAREIDSKA